MPRFPLSLLKEKLIVVIGWKWSIFILEQVSISYIKNGTEVNALFKRKKKVFCLCQAIFPPN